MPYTTLSSPNQLTRDMSHTLIYLDNHATTRVDPRVLQAMLLAFDSDYGNPASATHALGQRAEELVEEARTVIRAGIGAASPREIVFTSGATESNNLAIKGVAERHRQGHFVSVATEHPAVLNPLEKLARRGFRVTLLPVKPANHPEAGIVDLNELSNAVASDTILVSVMLANNEIGVIQPVREIVEICRPRGILVHTDATQAVGKIPVDVQKLDVDLMSFTAHKLYGPKGVGALYVRGGPRSPRLISQVDGGRQEGGRRGGTLNVPGILGFARALELSLHERDREAVRLAALRGQLYRQLGDALGALPLNGPRWEEPLESSARGADLKIGSRLPQNLNCQFPGIDGHTLMIHTPRVCLSSGSACTATSSEPSHVLRALGLDDDQARCSLRFGFGRFNDEAQIGEAAELLIDSARRLRAW